MNASPASAALAALLGVLLAAPLAAQVTYSDGKPTGFVTAQTGGIPAESWRGTSLATAKQLVSALPAAPRSRALRDLQFKVLVSELTPPPADGSPPPSLFTRKVERLAAMGEGESLNEMVRSANAYTDPLIATTVANAMMMAGQRQGACVIVRNWQLNEPFGRRAEAACRLLDGEAAAAVPPLAQADGPAVMSIDLGRGQPPGAWLGSMQPPVIRALVGMKSLPMATRIEVAERGEALAVIEATRLGDLYLEALRDGAVLPPAMAQRAQLVAAARRAANPQEIVNAIVTAYAAARGSPLFSTIARATAAALISLPAKPEFATVAQEAMRGFLLLGDRQKAQAWTRLALSAARNNAQVLSGLDRLLPLAAIAGVDEPKRLPPAEVNRWYRALQAADPGRAALQGYLLLELFRATGIDVPPQSTELPEALPPGARVVMPAGATLQALQAAAAGGRRAEAALLGAVAAGELALADLHPAGVAAIVRSLRQVGEDHAARLLAIETAIAYGL
ncbi:MAG: hypothetical protein U1E23_15175 [Reyranellaceae bacterium]